MILVDTGPLVAAALDGDVNHARCVEFFTSTHLNAEPLLVPSLVVTEVCYFLERESGARLEAEFLRSLAAGDFQLTEPTPADLDRAADLVITYADFPLGAVDATVSPSPSASASPKSPPSTAATSPQSAHATRTHSPYAQTEGSCWTASRHDRSAPLTPPRVPPSQDVPLRHSARAPNLRPTSASGSTSGTATPTHSCGPRLHMSALAGPWDRR